MSDITQLVVALVLFFLLDRFLSRTRFVNG